MKNDIKEYLHDVKILLPINNKDSKDFIKLLEENISDSDITDYDDLIENIGTPSSVASSFLADMDSDELVSKVKKNNYHRIIVTIVIVVIIICGVLRCIYLQDLYNKSKNQTPINIEEQITEGD